MAGQIFGGGAPKTKPVSAPKPIIRPAAAASSSPVMPMGPGGSSTGSGLGQAQQAPQPVIRPEVKAVSDTLSYAEGTWNDSNNSPNYGMRYGDRAGEASLDITQPHPGTVRSSAYGSGYSSDASGAFQFKKDTWSEMHGGNNAVMSPDNQDLAVGKLITAEGYDYNEPLQKNPSSSPTVGPRSQMNRASRIMVSPRPTAQKSLIRSTSSASSNCKNRNACASTDCVRAAFRS